MGLMSPMIGTLLEMPYTSLWFIHGIYLLCLFGNVYIAQQ